MKKPKSKIKRHVKNPLEMFNLNDILGFSGSEEKKQGREQVMVEGQEISFAKPQENAKDQEEKTEELQTEAGIDYLRTYSREISQVAERSVNQETREHEMQLREIMSEIKKLTDSSKELQMQFKEVAVEQHVVKPGKYHKSFFSWLLSVIRAARMKVEDSGAWLQAMQSKKKQKQYGAMSKKHGTSFSLSNERVVATQVG